MSTNAIRRLEKEPTPANIASSIESDIAGRNSDVLAFIRMLDSIDGPYTILLDGPWGQGKTFFIKSVEMCLNALNPQMGVAKGVDANKLSPIISHLKDGDVSILPLYFNAWENDFAIDPISAMFASFASQLDMEFLEKKPRLKNGLTKVMDTALNAGMKLMQVPFQIGISDIVDKFSSEDLVESYRKQRELRDAINELAEKGNLEIANKLVIFIDELDRCRPGFAIQLLEEVKSLFQGSDITVVISTDSVQLAHAIGSIYGSSYDSALFLERFFDLRVVLRPADSYKIVTGKSFQATTYRFDSLEQELLARGSLTPRDMMRLLPKLQEARAYANSDDHLEPFDRKLTSMVARSALLPLLIVVSRENQELFRAIVEGRDFDSLYEMGKDYESFKDTVREGLAHDSHPSDGGSTGSDDDDIKSYVHNLCVAIYDPDQNSKKARAARQWLGVDIQQYPSEIYKELRFPVHEG